MGSFSCSKCGALIDLMYINRHVCWATGPEGGYAYKDARTAANGSTLRPFICPDCEKLLDAAYQYDGNDRPDSGDFSVCFGCGGIVRFQADMSLKPATPADMSELHPDDLRLLVQAQTAIRFSAATRKK